MSEQPPKLKKKQQSSKIIVIPPKQLFKLGLANQIKDLLIKHAQAQNAAKQPQASPPTDNTEITKKQDNLKQVTASSTKVNNSKKQDKLCSQEKSELSEPQPVKISPKEVVQNVLFSTSVKKAKPKIQIVSNEAVNLPSGDIIALTANRVVSPRSEAILKKPPHLLAIKDITKSCPVRIEATFASKEICFDNVLLDKETTQNSPIRIEASSSGNLPIVKKVSPPIINEHFKSPPHQVKKICKKSVPGKEVVNVVKETVVKDLIDVNSEPFKSPPHQVKKICNKSVLPKDVINAPLVSQVKEKVVKEVTSSIDVNNEPFKSSPHQVKKICNKSVPPKDVINVPLVSQVKETVVKEVTTLVDVNSKLFKSPPHQVKRICKEVIDVPLVPQVKETVVTEVTPLIDVNNEPFKSPPHQVKRICKEVIDVPLVSQSKETFVTDVTSSIDVNSELFKTPPHQVKRICKEVIDVPLVPHLKETVVKKVTSSIDVSSEPFKSSPHQVKKICNINVPLVSQVKETVVTEVTSKRGRKRVSVDYFKLENPDVEVESSSPRLESTKGILASSTSDSPKRKRGRPKKGTTPTISRHSCSPSILLQTEIETPLIKKKRGRPRKNLQTTTPIKQPSSSSPTNLEPTPAESEQLHSSPITQPHDDEDCQSNSELSEVPAENGPELYYTPRKEVQSPPKPRVYSRGKRRIQIKISGSDSEKLTKSESDIESLNVTKNSSPLSIVQTENLIRRTGEETESIRSKTDDDDLKHECDEGKKSSPDRTYEDEVDAGLEPHSIIKKVEETGTISLKTKDNLMTDDLNCQTAETSVDVGNFSETGRASEGLRRKLNENSQIAETFFPEIREIDGGKKTLLDRASEINEKTQNKARRKTKKNLAVVEATISVPGAKFIEINETLPDRVSTVVEVQTETKEKQTRRNKLRRKTKENLADLIDDATNADATILPEIRETDESNKMSLIRDFQIGHSVIETIKETGRKKSKRVSRYSLAHDLTETTNVGAANFQALDETDGGKKTSLKQASEVQIVQSKIERRGETPRNKTRRNRKHNFVDDLNCQPANTTNENRTIFLKIDETLGNKKNEVEVHPDLEAQAKEHIEDDNPEFDEIDEQTEEHLQNDDPEIDKQASVNVQNDDLEIHEIDEQTKIVVQGDDPKIDEIDEQAGVNVQNGDPESDEIYEGKKLPLKRASEEELNTDFKTKRICNEENNFSDSPKKDVPYVCAVCKMSVKKNQWRYHKLRNHNNLAWHEGEPPLDLEDKSFVKRKLQLLVNKKIKLHCDQCDAQLKSVLGFLSHQEQCNKSEEEIEQSKVACEVCGRKVLSVSLYSHMRLVHKGSLGIFNEIAAHEENEPLEKRLAAKRALDNIETLQKADRMTADKEALWECIQRMQKYYTVWTDFREKKYVLRILESKQLFNKVLQCPYEGCKEISENAKEMQEHMSDCKEKPGRIFCCKICLHVLTDEMAIINHIKVVHGINDKCKDKTSLVKNQSRTLKLAENMNCFNGDTRKYPKFVESTRDLYVYRHSYKWTYNFCTQNFIFLLYEKYTCAEQNYALIDDQSLEMYLPKLAESCEVAFVRLPEYVNPITALENVTTKKFELFETQTEEYGNFTIFCGGPVSALSWIPTPFDAQNCQQVLALSVLDNADKTYSTEGTETWAKCMIQFWGLGPLTNSKCSNRTPELLFCFGIEFGPVLHLEWCPSGCYNLEPATTNNRLGLLAVAGYDSCVHIYSVPAYDTGLFYKPKALVKLSLESNPDTLKTKYYPTRISWTKAAGHKYIAVGYNTGMVGVFNLQTTSPLLWRKGSDNSDVLLPYTSFAAHTHFITGVHLNHMNDSRWLFTTSFEKEEKVWDLQNTNAPPVSSSKTNVVSDSACLTHWLFQILSNEDTFSNARIVVTHHKQVRDYLSTRKGVLISQSTVSALSTSDWLNCAMQGNVMGEVSGIFFNQAFWAMDASKSVRSKMMIFGYAALIEKGKTKEELNQLEEEKLHALENTLSTRRIIKDEELQPGRDLSHLDYNPHYYQYEPINYEEATSKYSLIFCDYKMSQQSHIKILKNRKNQVFKLSRPNLYPLQSVTKLAINPNKQSSLYFAIGYKAGFVRVRFIKALNDNLTEISKVY